MYCVMDASVALGTTSIANSISLCGGNPGNSSGNKSEKSLTVGISDTLGLAFTVSIHKPSWLHILSTPLF